MDPFTKSPPQKKNRPLDPPVLVGYRYRFLLSLRASPVTPGTASAELHPLCSLPLLQPPCDRHCPAECLPPPRLPVPPSCRVSVCAWQAASGPVLAAPGAALRTARPGPSAALHRRAPADTGGKIRQSLLSAQTRRCISPDTQRRDKRPAGVDPRS